MKHPVITTRHIIISSVVCFIIILGCILIGISCDKRKEERVKSSTVIDEVTIEEPITVEETSIDEVVIEEEPPTLELKDVDTIAQEVINGDWGTGQDRIDRLTAAGYNAEEIQAVVDELMPEQIVYYTDTPYQDEYVYYSDGNVLNPYIGVVYYNGHKETYYSQQVLPGGGLDIPGRHVAADGTIRDGDGYICVAADWSYLPYGSIVETSLGTGKVYDTGCAYGTVDIYTNW